MKSILWSFVWLFSVMACSPATQNTKEGEEESERDYMMDDDMMEEEEVEDDSLKNRDMLSRIHILP